MASTWQIDEWGQIWRRSEAVLIWIIMIISLNVKTIMFFLSQLTVLAVLNLLMNGKLDHFAPVVGRMVVSTAVQSGRRRGRNIGWARNVFSARLLTHFDTHIWSWNTHIQTKEALAGWGYSIASLHFICVFLLYCTFVLLIV